MIELRRTKLKRSKLIFSFPEVHENAKLEVTFLRTLRIPDDDEVYSLPPGLGEFPVRLIDDFAEKAPAEWLERGGVMLPMYQSEALWISFSAQYPFAVKVAAGKVNAVTGDPWTDEFQRQPQDYVVSPGQPWLDGFCVGEGVIRQFVAMPLGAGYSAEEQITGEAEHGGIQLIVSPFKKEAYERPPVEQCSSMRDMAVFSRSLGQEIGGREPLHQEMALAPGGQMRQEIFDDPYKFADWDFSHKSRCFVHLSNSLTWRAITGEQPPTTPFTAKEYTQQGLPWFEYYEDNLKAVKGSKILAGFKSIATIGKEKGDVPLPENESATPEKVITLRKGLQKNQVREGRF
jgi:hypothetical protein